MSDDLDYAGDDDSFRAPEFRIWTLAVASEQLPAGLVLVTGATAAPDRVVRVVEQAAQPGERGPAMPREWILHPNQQGLGPAVMVADGPIIARGEVTRVMEDWPEEYCQPNMMQVIGSANAWISAEDHSNDNCYVTDEVPCLCGLASMVSSLDEADILLTCGHDGPAHAACERQRDHAGDHREGGRSWLRDHVAPLLR